MYLKSFLETLKNQSCMIEEDIEIYYSMFCSVFMNLVEHDMLDNHTCCCWFLLSLSKKMQSKFMKKYNINFKNSSMLNFEELYAVIIKKTKCIEFKHSFMKIMRESTFKKLNHQKKSLMRNDTIIVYVNDMFLFCQQLKFVKKSKLKIISNAVIQN